jgi:hypothetical protein
LINLARNLSGQTICFRGGLEIGGSCIAFGKPLAADRFFRSFTPARLWRVKAKGQIGISLCSIEFLFFHALF